MIPTPPADPAGHILTAALDYAPEDREAFLALACGENAALLAKVRALLAAHEAMPTGCPTEPASVESESEGEGIVNANNQKTVVAPAGVGREDEGIMNANNQKTVVAPAGVEREGGRIGRYKLLQQIGEGGFGTVWMAEQMEPVSRRVALKIIKPGMDTREIIARFEAERQAVAMMDHPNIAKVFDAGATDTGRPFFVMELVKGIPITQYCDEAGLGTRERLALFGDVCSAINHAHQKGVIHRDIKPSNVMVTLHGDKPVVKVIDFGIAKATQGKLTDKTLFTRFEQFVGTPVYMSPEQASLSGLDVDTRSDIYALGILLYELLVGKPPFDAQALLSAGYEEMRRIIREVEPVRPSSRISTMAAEERTQLAKARHVEPEKLGKLVEPDLDWIVMKAIDKDRTRRYETANAFAQDIAHFLADEAVIARPPSAGYQFRKFARRNNAALRVAAAIAAVLVAATLVSTWQAVRATRAEKRTVETLVQVAAERDAKEVARKDAEDISTFLGEVFQSPDPTRDGHDIKVVELLDKAAAKLDTDLSTQLAQRAKLQATLGRTYCALRLFQQAIPLFEKVRDYHLATYGPEHPDTLSAMNDLARVCNSAYRWDEAIKLLEEVLRVRRKLLGPEHPDTLKAMDALASPAGDPARIADAIKIKEDVLTLYRKVFGPEHPDTLVVMHGLANLYGGVSREFDALKLREEVLALSRKINGPEHPATLRAMMNLATSYSGAGRWDECLKLREEVLALSRKVHGPEHPDTFLVMHGLVDSYQNFNRTDDAIKLLEEALPVILKRLGPEYMLSLYTMHSLASFYHAAGRTGEAIKLLEEALPLLRKVVDPEQPVLMRATMCLLAKCYRAAGRTDDSTKLFEEVIKLFEEARALSRKVNGPERPFTPLERMNDLAYSYGAVGRTDDAIKLFEEVLTLLCKQYGPECEWRREHRIDWAV